jgi:GNAT superfamily N-acetyltransferase
MAKTLSFWKSILNYEERPLTQHSSSRIRLSSPLLEASPTGISYSIAQSKEEFSNIRFFLKTYFGNPPLTPLLRPHLSNEDIILYVRENSSIESIVGCIRYTYAGNFEEEIIYKIDCFCIHPRWRKKSVGSYLLSALHKETMERGLCYSIFLKESAPIYALTHPFYSSMYMFKRIHPSSHSYIIQWPLEEQVFKIIHVFKSLYPNLFILINHKTTEWRLFKYRDYILFIGCQESFQEHPETKSPIGWVTGWLESPRLTWRPDRSQIIDAMLSTLPYKWFWTDKRWVEEAIGWKEDGPFHWYSYQWKPTLTPSGNYILCG